MAKPLTSKTKHAMDALGAGLPRRGFSLVEEDPASDVESDFGGAPAPTLPPTSAQATKKSLRQMADELQAAAERRAASTLARPALADGHDPNKKEVTRKRGWFEIETPELTPQIKADLRALQLRQYLDPKRFYKANDRKAPPTVFQIGTVVAGVGEGAEHRVKRKDRKKSFVDEVLADSAAQAYTKRVFRDLQDQRQSVIKVGRRKGKGRGKGGKKR